MTCGTPSKVYLEQLAAQAEMKGDFSKAAELYGRVFKMERSFAGWTRSARNQTRCAFAAWSANAQA